MKRWGNCISILLCIAFALSAMCTVAHADAPPASYREHFSQSEQAAFERILEQTDAESQADTIIKRLETDGTSRIGMEEWFAIYSFYGSFEELADAPAEDFLDKLSSDPALYVPVYHCPEGERERLIGCVVVSKYGTLGEEIRYRANAMTYGGQQGYIYMPDRIGSFAKVQEIGKRYGLQSVSHAVAVSVPSPYSGFENTLLLMLASGVWHVYDFEDSLTLEAAGVTEKLYTLEEYIDLRVEIEQNQPPSPWSNALRYILIAVVVIAVIVIGLITCLVIWGVRAYKKRKSNNGK